MMMDIRVVRNSGGGSGGGSGGFGGGFGGGSGCNRGLAPDQTKTSVIDARPSRRDAGRVETQPKTAGLGLKNSQIKFD